MTSIRFPDQGLAATEIGGITFFPADGPADWEPGGAAWERSVSLFEEVGERIRGTQPVQVVDEGEEVPTDA